MGGSPDFLSDIFFEKTAELAAVCEANASYSGSKWRGQRSEMFSSTSLFDTRQTHQTVKLLVSSIAGKAFLVHSTSPLLIET